MITHKQLTLAEVFETRNEYREMLQNALNQL